MKSKKKLTNIFAVVMSGVSLASILLIGALWISFERNRSSEDSLKITRDYIAAQEDSINLETNRICDYIEAQRQANQIYSLQGLKDRVYEAHAVLEALARETGNLPPDQARRVLLEALSGVVFNQGRGRYFVTDLTGRRLLPAAGPEYADSAGRAAFQQIVSSLSLTGEGFYRFNLTPPSPGGGDTPREPQISFLKIFEPLGWVIGTGEYLEDFDAEIQRELLDWAGRMPMPNDSYLMLLDYDGNILISPDADAEGLNIFLDTQVTALQKVAARIIRGAKERTKDFVRYTVLNQETNEPNERIAYFRAIPAWRWVMVTWVYFKDLEGALAEQRAALDENMQSQVYRIVAISISMLLLVMLISRIISSMATRSFAAFFTFFEKASTSAMKVNVEEQPFDEFARLALAANSMIAQRRLAEQLLRESELKFKTIFDVSPQIITISDLDGRLIDANEEYLKYSSAASLAAAIGRPMIDTFIIDEEQSRELWRDLKEAGVVSGRELAGVPSQRPGLALLAFARMISLGTSAYVLAVFIDISDLKAAESEKLELQGKLAQSKKMEAMGLMAAEVAHDLNNILSGIIGYPQLLLRESNITEKQKAALSEILETGKKAAAVVSDLLTIARGVATLKESISFNSVVKGYVSSPECKQLEEFFPLVRLAVEFDPGAGNIIGSSVHLTKIVMNLVSNAFEAMPPDKENGRVTIETRALPPEETPPAWVKSRDDEAPGAWVSLSIADNGPGIPEGDREKIFEPFYSKKVKGRSGTGLGLAIVWNTVQDHGGLLDLQTGSAGTTFTLYFRKTEIQANERAVSGDLENFHGRGERILVVDDVDIQRKLASKMLATLGYEPRAVPSGEAAVELLRKENFDLVILDMIMHPGMNGRETYSAIMEFKPGQKAIIASGMAETEEVAKAQALGAGQFVNKPYTLEDIAVAVRKALSG